MSVRQVIEADWTWLDGRFQAGVRIAVDDAGRIAAVGPLPQPPTRRLKDRALLPGFVNGHSHAFQRGLRGWTENFAGGAGSFWTWREAMYALVQRLDRERFRSLCRLAFDEMLATGVTSVAEFHYLHHDDPLTRDFALDRVLLETAAEAGVRLVLLATYYRTGGIGKPLVELQRRFETRSLDEFRRQLDRLAAQLDRPRQTLGIAAHSIRAVPPEDLIALRREAADRGWPFHMHVEEQRQEVEECSFVLGTTPLEWLLEHVEIGPRFTAIHATHASGDALDRFLAAGGNICLCPITEANLGDGMADVPRMLERPEAVCIGTDSNIRIDLPEELRWLEYGQRLRLERRGVCRGLSGDVAAQLLDCGTVNGARALGLDAGRIAVGLAADLFTIDLTCPALSGWTPQTLAASFLCGGDGSVVREVCVGGRWVLGV